MWHTVEALKMFLHSPLPFPKRGRDSKMQELEKNKRLSNPSFFIFYIWKLKHSLDFIWLSIIQHSKNNIEQLLFAEIKLLNCPVVLSSIKQG